MTWKPLGLLFSPGGTHAAMRSHASLPVALPLEGSTYRIFFASRDGKNRSHVWYGDFDLGSAAPPRVAAEPVLEPGPLGHFDDHGVYPASIVARGGRLFLYYIGWNPGARPPLFYASIGLAVSDDGGRSFRRHSVAPILARSEHDPCLVTSPCVLVEGGLWRMWYVSGFKWTEDAQGLHSYYHVKYAESDDGIAWRRGGLVCVDLRPGERNVARPCVVREGEEYHMWYSFDAGAGYRIGHARSADGLAWTRRDDEAGIGPSGEGWDAEAQAYPWVFRHEGRRYMLYNGDGFGRTGFGLAVEPRGPPV